VATKRQGTESKCLYTYIYYIIYVTYHTCTYAYTYTYSPLSLSSWLRAQGIKWCERPCACIELHEVSPRGEGMEANLKRKKQKDFLVPNPKKNQSGPDGPNVALVRASDSVGRFCCYYWSTLINYKSNLFMSDAFLSRLLPPTGFRVLLPTPKGTTDEKSYCKHFNGHFVSQKGFLVPRIGTILVRFHPLVRTPTRPNLKSISIYNLLYYSLINRTCKRMIHFYSAASFPGTNSPFPRRWDSKWSSECKTKSKSESRNCCSRSLFKFSNEKTPRTIDSWFWWGFRCAFRRPFRDSSSRERDVNEFAEILAFSQKLRWFSR